MGSWRSCSPSAARRRTDGSSAGPSLTLADLAALLTAFAAVERRAKQPLIPVAHLEDPAPWYPVRLSCSAISGILVGAVFLTSIFVQTVLGFSPLVAGVAFVPFALAITVGTQVARHLIAHASPRVVAVVGLLLTGVAAGASSRLATAVGELRHQCPSGPPRARSGSWHGLRPVSVTSMAGIPAQHAGTASGFLMTGHEVGAALGVAVLSAVAATAGSLVSPAGVAAGFSRGFLAAAAIALVLAAVHVPSNVVGPSHRRWRWNARPLRPSGSTESLIDCPLRAGAVMRTLGDSSLNVARPPENGVAVTETIR